MHQKKKVCFFVLLVLFFLIAGLWYVWKERERPQTVERVLLTLTPEPTKCPDDSVIGEEPAETVEIPPQTIFVFLCGAVVSPGVYEMPEGSRLVEAISLAGGFLPEADTDYHNLARTVSDGERVYILTKEESAQLSLQKQVAGETVQESNTETEAKEKRVNLNTATVAELTTLPGIGESRAESIIEYRTKVGRFQKIEEIMNISGIGEAMFEKIKDRITTE